MDFEASFKINPRRILILALSVLLPLIAVGGCSMSEEMKRIEEVRQSQLRQAATNSGDLTGEQVFIRSCNACHPGGKEGMGPALDHLSEHFPEDASLKAFIRSGKGMMPSQPPQIINDQELSNLVQYLRGLNES